MEEGKSSEAWDLLSGDSYQVKKRDYEHGLEVFSRKLQDYADDTVDSARREAFTFLVTAFIFGGVVLSFFVMGLYSFIRVLRRKDVLIE